MDNDDFDIDQLFASAGGTYSVECHGYATALTEARTALETAQHELARAVGYAMLLTGSEHVAAFGGENEPLCMTVARLIGPVVAAMHALPD
jgi:hypothetical protein